MLVTFLLIILKKNLMSKIEEKSKVINCEVPNRLITDDVINFANTCSDMIQLYAKKNHDYGNSFNKGMNDIGMSYGIGRLYDKMNRIVTLSKVESEVKDESIKDTLLDLACYAIMTYNSLNKNNNGTY